MKKMEFLKLKKLKKYSQKMKTSNEFQNGKKDRDEQEKRYLHIESSQSVPSIYKTENRTTFNSKTNCMDSLEYKKLEKKIMKKIEFYKLKMTKKSAKKWRLRTNSKMEKKIAMSMKNVSSTLSRLNESLSFAKPKKEPHLIQKQTAWTH